MASSQGTSFSFDFYKSKPGELMYQVDAHFPKETPFLRLTKTDDHDNPQPRSTGRVLYSKQVEFGHAVSFDTSVSFTVRTSDTATSHADGLVFFIVPADHSFPSTTFGGNLGIFEPTGKSPHVFAAAFDIFPIPSDPGYVHLGIDIESRKPVAFTQIPADSFIGDGKDVTLTVSYAADTKLITARASNGHQTFPVSCEYDLSSILPPAVHVGLASSTGEFVAVHDVASWAFHSPALNN